MSKYEIISKSKSIDREEIVDFLARIYGPNYYDAYIVQGITFDKEPSTAPQNFILARSPKGELIGIVRIVERTIFVDGIQISCGGISSVSVKPAWRNQNIASLLMETAIQVMTTSNMDISILHGRHAVDGFYVAFGYYGIGRYVDLEIITPSDPPDFIPSVIPFEEKHLETCIHLYNETYQKLTGSFVRDRGIWEFLLARTEHAEGKTQIMMCAKDQQIVGYLISAQEKLIEIALTPQYHIAVPYLLSVLGIQSISIHPRHPLFVYLLTNLNTTQKERFALNGGYMARLLNPEKLLEKLGAVLAARAKVLGISDQTIRMLNLEIKLANGQVSKSNERNDISFNKMETTIQLLLGVIRPEDIVGIHWTSEKPWIPYLFPNLHYHTSAWDEI